MAEQPEADELYALPLEDFTRARNELAARLRKQGDRAAAEAVKGLAKPSITAWALNQVARREARLVERLLKAGDGLRQAQQALLAGGGQAAFREATQAERDALGALVQAAANLLAEAGHAGGKATLDRVEATARAASTDASAGEQLRAGRLAADLDPAGFSGLGAEPFAAPAAPIPFPTKRRESPAAAAAEEPDGRGARLAAARDQVRRLQQELQGLRTNAGEAEGNAAKARQTAVKADRAWADARNAAARAEKALAQARRVEEEAAEELGAVRARIDQTAEALEAAEAALRELRRE